MYATIAVLLVDDDATARRVLSSVLQRGAHHVVCAASGEAALSLLSHQAFDVVLTDIWMHETSGIDVLLAARQLPDPPEVILMTGTSTVDMAVAALRAGAFDYLTKPSTAEEILAAVRAAAQRRDEQRRRIATLRRVAAEVSAQLPVKRAPEVPPAPGRDGHTPEQLVVGELTLDCFRHTASFGGQLVHLTPTEFALLVCLAQSAGRVVTWTEITDRTHQTAFTPHEAHDLLRVHIGNVRRKIPPEYLVTVRGVGFMLVDPQTRLVVANHVR